MINFETKNIDKIKKLLKSYNLNDIKKESFIKRNENGWGIYLLKDRVEKFEIENLMAMVIFSLPPKTYIAHKHLSDIDEEYCHYVLRTNENCGIIVKDHYLNYTDNLLFSFDGLLPHIVWNNGNETRDSLVFAFKKPNLTKEEWVKEKLSVANGDYVDNINLTTEEIKKMTGKFNIKLP